MPSKSRRHRGKYSVQSKKKEGRPSRPASLVQRPVATHAEELVSSTEVTAPAVSAPAPVAKPTGLSYPYIVGELRTIGIVAGIMLIVLVVLALVLS